MRVPIPVDLEKSWGRQQAGEQRALRRAAHLEVFRYVDPEALRESEQPPHEVQAMMEEVLGQEACEDVKLLVHPLLRRWCLFQKVRDPESGQINAWGVVSIFHTGGEDGYLPPDLDGRWTRHLRGIVGDMRHPTRLDFELIDKANVKKWGEDVVMELYNQHEDQVERDLEYDFNARVEDFLDYHFWLAMRDAQEHYSRPWSVDTVEEKSGPRWVTVVKPGALGGSLRMRVRFGSPAHMTILAEALDDLRAMREEKQRERGLSRGVKRVIDDEERLLEKEMAAIKREKELAELYSDLRSSPEKFESREAKELFVRRAAEAFAAR